MATLIVTLIGIALAFASTMIGGATAMVVGAIGSLMAAWGAYRAYRDSRPYVVLTTESSWQDGDDGYVFVEITPAEHGKGKNPIVQTFQRDEDGNLSEIIGDLNVSAKGVVRCLTFGCRMVGTIVIK